MALAGKKALKRLRSNTGAPLPPISPGNTLAVVSFRLMRFIVGILGLTIGILLPLITWLFTPCDFVQESISHYYYTIAGDIFVGLLCAVAFFMIAYPGDGEWEDLLTNIAGACALVVAFFPTTYNQIDTSCTRQGFKYDSWVGTVHLIAAALFFGILSYIAFFQFTKRVPANMKAGVRNNRILLYKICGIIMAVSIAALAPMKWSDSYSDFLSRYKLIFAFEVEALLAFGICWLVKGTEK